MQSFSFYVGDRPGGAWNIQVIDENSGQPLNLSGYLRVRALMLDPENIEVRFPEEHAYVTDGVNGVVTFLWPSESVFTKPGNYVMQLEFSGEQVTRKTSAVNIRVRKLGGVVR